MDHTLQQIIQTLIELVKENEALKVELSKIKQSVREPDKKAGE